MTNNKLRNKGKRSGIAIIIALIFMMAFLTISTTISQQAMNVVNRREHAGKSEQARYNAESAAGKARMLYYMTPEESAAELDEGETLSGGEFKKHTNTSGKKDGNYRILGISGSQGKLSAKIEDYNVYPYPGTGTAGKDCDVYNQIADSPDATSASAKYSALLQKYEITAAGFGFPEDFSCSWNKIRSFDSAVEIPLYAIAPDGTKVWLKFDEIKIRVRTACDETQLKGAEKEIYNETGMCGKGKRFGMMFDWDISKPKIDTIDYLKNTVLNWGIYSDKGNTNYLIPIKDEKKPAETGNSNIHTKAINDANPGLPFSTSVSPKGDFVVLDGNTKGVSGFLMEFPLIINALNQSSADSAKPQISNPYLRLTVENKFLAEDSFPMNPKYIPHLEYQILYKINGTSLPAEMDINTAQISGIPVIIGEGYSGGFKHTVKMTIIETKTGFDYLYQKP